MSWVFALLLLLILAACWVLTLLGMPGNWLIVISTALYAYLWPVRLGWRTVVVVLALAVLGEVLELFTSVVTTSRAGGSRRGAFLALVGSLVGGVAGLFIGLPVPLIGSILAAVLFAGLGAMAGAVLGETWKGKTMGKSLEVGHAAFWGRLTGTLAKSMCGAVMVLAVALGMLL